MQHGMAIRTDWNKVLKRINNVACPYLGNRYNMMNMNKVMPEFAIDLFKIHAAYRTVISFSGKT